MKHVAFPFLTLGDEHVSATRWSQTTEDGVAAGLRDFIENWDYARDVRISRTVLVQDNLPSRTLGIRDEDVSLSIAVRLGTGTGSLPRRAWMLASQPIAPGSAAVLDFVIPGSRLSQRLWLETTITLANPPGSADSALAPRVAGSILWRDKLDVALEGQAPRFPMEIVSFSERFGERAEGAAPWLLHWLPGHLHRDFGGAVRLYLNHDRPEFIERFVAADSLTLQVTLADVVNQIVSFAVRQDDLGEQLVGAEPTSLAGHIATWLGLAFPGQSLANVRTLLETAPGRFSASILAMADPQMLGVDP